MSNVCTIVDLDKLILESKISEVNFGNELVQVLCYGYSCDYDSKDKLCKLQRYRKILEDENKNIKSGKSPCLNGEELLCLSEKVNKLTFNCNTSEYKDLIVDKSNTARWIAGNPYCVAREKWEYLAYAILCDINLEVDLLDMSTVCDISLDLVTKDLSCDILVAIDTYRKNCDLGLKVSRTTFEECKVDFEALTKTLEGCDISFDHYARLIECNLSYDIIKTVYGNNCSLNFEADATSQSCDIESEVNISSKDCEVDAEASVTSKSCSIYLQVGSDSSHCYPLEMFTITEELDISSMQNYGIDMANSEYAENPKWFIKKLNRDYSG